MFFPVGAGIRHDPTVRYALTHGHTPVASTKPPHGRQSQPRLYQRQQAQLRCAHRRQNCPAFPAPSPSAANSLKPLSAADHDYVFPEDYATLLREDLRGGMLAARVCARQARDMDLRLLLTGGTIDKRYNEISENCELIGTSAQAMLEQGRVRLRLAVEHLMSVDSLDMTDGQRREILSACLRCEESRVVIAHGTSTIIQTAQTLGPCIDGKTIVLFGAMIPYALGRSDALFNFGAALMAAQTLARGSTSP